jgi:hypothetical protein
MDARFTIERLTWFAVQKNIERCKDIFADKIMLQLAPRHCKYLSLIILVLFGGGILHLEIFLNGITLVAIRYRWFFDYHNLKIRNIIRSLKLKAYILAVILTIVVYECSVLV